MLSFHLGNTPNVAFSKEVVQSSTVAPASRATDGSTRVDYNGGSCSRTKPQTDPWLQVDLADDYNIQQVTLVASTDLQSKCSCATTVSTWLTRH